MFVHRYSSLYDIIKAITWAGYIWAREAIKGTDRWVGVYNIVETGWSTKYIRYCVWLIVAGKLPTATFMECWILSL